MTALAGVRKSVKILGARCKHHDDDEDEIQELPLILVAWSRPVLLRHWTGWWAVELVDGKMVWR